MSSAERLIIISCDGHAGADVLGYKPYLAAEFHDDFDEWAATYQDPWSMLDADQDPDNRMGVSSFASTINWDSGKRLQLVEAEGIAGEVLFPNTAAPFFPSGAVSAHVPASGADYERRCAGLQAHNRWLADFCAEVPGRRAGIAQVFFNDVERAIEEVRWAKESGLMGVLLPSDHMLQLSNLYYPKLDRFWAVCAELEMPLHRHAVVPSEAASAEAGQVAPLIGFFELRFFLGRPITHMILSGVFDRYPALKLVVTEAGGGMALIGLAQDLDEHVKGVPGEGPTALFYKDAARALKKLPTEYFRSNVYHASFLNNIDIENRHKIGVDRMMWGADIPHHEGTHPFTREALRLNFAGLPDDEIRRMTSGTAFEVYSFDPQALQPIADRVGPTLDEIHVVVSPDEVSDDTKLFCPTFRSLLPA